MLWRGYPVKLQEYMDNIIQHFQNNHSKCHPTSRWKVDRNYEPLRIVLASKNAKNLLEYLLSESVKDKYIQEFALRKDTFMLEVSKMSWTFLKD